MPYRLDLVATADDAVDRLIELGALDIDSSGPNIAAVMPDAVAPPQVSAALGARLDSLAISPALGRDDDSVWILRPRSVRVGRWLLVPATPATATAADGTGGTGGTGATGRAPGHIFMNDSPAFGTGLHATTALCLEMLDDLIPVNSGEPPARALDVGIGSGVLALAAIDAGVAEVLGIDIDPSALQAAVANATINGVGDRLHVRAGEPSALDGAWPLILANVLAAPLIDMAPALVRRLSSRGQLILSGIPESMTGEVEAGYRRLGLRHVDVRSRAGWAALHLAASW